MPFHEFQLQFMTDLAQHRPEWLQSVLLFLNHFDTPLFYFILIPTLWLGVSYKWGLKIFYWLTVNSLVNAMAKSLVGWPRPNHELTGIGLIPSNSNGFPSGGAQGSIFLGILLIYYWKTRAAWIVASFYILIISASRVYLGIHYPIDVLGGWGIGAIVALLFIRFEDRIEIFLKRRGLLFCLFLTVLIPAAIYWKAVGVGYVAGAMMGIGIGSCLSLKANLFLPNPTTVLQGAARAILGVIMIFTVLYVMPANSSFFMQSLLASLFMSLAASPIIKLF